MKKVRTDSSSFSGKAQGASEERVSGEREKMQMDLTNFKECQKFFFCSLPPSPSESCEERN